MRRRRPLAARRIPDPPERLRRFVASEWGWDGPRYKDGRLVLAHFEAEHRYFAAWEAWMDEHDVALEDWWDLVGPAPMTPDEPFDGTDL